MTRKRSIIILLFCLCVGALHAQNDSVKMLRLDGPSKCGMPGYVILIDGKIPLSAYTIITFDPKIFKDTVQYSFPHFFVIYSADAGKSMDTVPDLCSIIPDSAKVYLEYRFREPVGRNKYKDHLYQDSLSWKYFYDVEYVNIQNINKQHYHINYVQRGPSRLVRPYDKKKYGNYRRFKKKISRGWFPTHYSYPTRPGEKSTPQYF
ncbi:MAG: hypothetical protein IKU03_02370 [Bacteroidales bacterium]|nr:hypothetical protein [Bacteroidales bacterium]